MLTVKGDDGCSEEENENDRVKWRDAGPSGCVWTPRSFVRLRERHLMIRCAARILIMGGCDQFIVSPLSMVKDTRGLRCIWGFTDEQELDSYIRTPKRSQDHE